MRWHTSFEVNGGNARKFFKVNSNMAETMDNLKNAPHNLKKSIKTLKASTLVNSHSSTLHAWVSIAFRGFPWVHNQASRERKIITYIVFSPFREYYVYSTIFLIWILNEASLSSNSSELLCNFNCICSNYFNLVMITPVDVSCRRPERFARWWWLGDSAAWVMMIRLHFLAIFNNHVRCNFIARGEMIGGLFCLCCGGSGMRQ